MDYLQIENAFDSPRHSTARVADGDVLSPAKTAERADRESVALVAAADVVVVDDDYELLCHYQIDAVD